MVRAVRWEVVAGAGRRASWWACGEGNGAGRAPMISYMANVNGGYPLRAHVCMYMCALHVVIVSRQFVHPGVDVHPIRMTIVMCT